MNGILSQADPSQSRRSRFLIGLMMFLGCAALGSVWQLWPRTETGDFPSGLIRAKRHLADGRLDLAEASLKAHLHRYPNSTEALEELRWLYFNQFRNREIEELLEAHLVQFPDDVSVAIELLNCEFRKQLPREGIGYLREINQQQPGQAAVQLALGYCHWQIGENDAARTALQAALKQRPDHRETRYIAAEFLMESGEVEAVATLVAEDGDTKGAPEPVMTNRDDDRVWYLRSLIAEHFGDVDSAYRAITRASAKRPGDLRYVHREGLLLQRLGRKEDATFMLQRANELEGFQSELSEIVLRGQHTEPTPELCERLAELLREFRRDVPSRCWRQLGHRMAASNRRP